MLIAADTVVVTHAGRVKQMATLQEQDRATAARYQAAAGKDRSGDGNSPPAG